MEITEQALSLEETHLADIAPEGISMLPRRLDDDGRALFESSTYTLLKILGSEGVEVHRVVPNGTEAEISENAFELLIPTILISASYLSQRPDLVSLSISLIAAYIFDFFKGARGEKTVKCKIIIKGETTKMIFFEGPPESFKELKNILGSYDEK